MSNEEHCGEKKVYYCRDSGLLEQGKKVAKPFTSTSQSVTPVTASQNVQSSEKRRAVASVMMPSLFVFPGADNKRKKSPSQKSIGIVPVWKEPCPTLIE